MAANFRFTAFTKKHLSKPIFYLETFILLLCGCSPSPNLFNPNPDGDQDYKRAVRYSHKYLEHFMTKTGTIGMAVTVIDGDKVVYSEGFGYADLDLKKKTSDTTIFRTGSMGKLFTAIAIMQLVEQGKVCLDSSITAYLPEFTIKSRFKARQITVRDLLTHESGLPSDIQYGSITGQHSYPGADTMYRTIVGLFENEYVTNPPRTAWSYSNAGFSLLGCIVERASKCTFAGYVRDSIFSRLHMNHSAVGIDNALGNSALSKCYFGKKRVDPVYIRDIPAGDITTSVADLSRFIRMLFSGGTLEGKYILASSTLEQMWTQQNGDIPLDFRKMGLCFFLDNYFGSTLTFIQEKTAVHGGDIPPFHTYLVTLPEVKLGVVVMVNSEQGSSIPSEASLGLLEIFYEAKKCRKIIIPPKNNEPVVKLPAQRLQELAGYYQATNAAGYIGTSKAEIKGTELVFDFFGKQVSLVPHTDSTFSIQHKLFGLIPIPAKTLRDIRLESHRVGAHQIFAFFYRNLFIGVIAEKFLPKAPSGEWLNRVGNYTIMNERKPEFNDVEAENYYGTSDFTISYDSTMQDLSINGLPLEILSSTEAVTRGIGRHEGESVCAFRKEGIEYLSYSGYSLKRKERSITK